MRGLRFFVLLPLLAACAGGASWPSNPQDVSFIADRLTVHFNDGLTCVAQVTGNGEGAFPGCAQDMRYRVSGYSTGIVGAVAGTALSQFTQIHATVDLYRPADGRRWQWLTPATDSFAPDAADNLGLIDHNR